MPLNRLRHAPLNLPAARRTPDSRIAGGVAINHDGPRVSDDIDIFHDSEERMAAAVEDKAEADATRLDWVTDSAYRFFPAQKDALFGYTVSASVGRFPGMTPEEMLAMIGHHARFTEAVGYVFTDGDRATQPDPGQLERYPCHQPSRQGIWPGSPEIGSAMPDRTLQPPNDETS